MGCRSFWELRSRGCRSTPCIGQQDALYENKGRIEELLRGAEQTLFDLKEQVILYDPTNTYFGGRSYQRGELSRSKSKDRRNDCLLIAVGLVVDEWGFAKRASSLARPVD